MSGALEVFTAGSENFMVHFETKNWSLSEDDIHHLLNCSSCYPDGISETILIHILVSINQ